MLDALGLSVSAALSLGTDLPIQLGINAGYTPSFGIDDDAGGRRGALHAAFFVGVGVPLIDLN